MRAYLRYSFTIAWISLGASFFALQCGFPEKEFDDAKFNQILNSELGGNSGAGGFPAGAGGDTQGGAGNDQGGAGNGPGGNEQGGAGDGGSTIAGQGGAGQGGDNQGGAGEGGNTIAGQGGEAGAGGAGQGGAPCEDEGKTLTCGKGECERSVPACVDGITQKCVPGQPIMEVCSNNLDDNCNGKIDEYCAGSCAHDICTPAAKLKPECSPCVGAICETGKFAKCCTDTWSPDCLAAVSLVCGVAICKGNSCVHSPCTEGPPLAKGCDYPSTLGKSCVSQICEEEPSCCDNNGAWNTSCVEKVNTICKLGCSL